MSNIDAEGFTTYPRCSRTPRHNFDLDTLKWIRIILAPDPPHDPQPLIADKMTHYLWEITRISHQARASTPAPDQNAATLSITRAAQLGLNIGRAQELMRLGGISAWWGEFEPMIAQCDWEMVYETALLYLRMFDLYMPSVEYINRPLED